MIVKSGKQNHFGKKNSHNNHLAILKEISVSYAAILLLIIVPNFWNI